MKALLFCSSLILSLLVLPARAEYRVFVLKISQPATDPKLPPAYRLVTSTLDPDQYRGYYPVAANETITYIATWRCYGRTDHRPPCPNPRQPASTTQGPDSISPAAQSAP